ncbi:MAG: tRNA (N6-isopentenyl adenosine(37)-C2)-methylthiotransferase MiaB [Ruminococcaceae bacterium]|nr:tRNA (N6-isopentenyl adenosine(37)-C2)-methylthiotransferase MiaB [Oscillospiraceae bacterium]
MAGNIQIISPQMIKEQYDYMSKVRQINSERTLYATVKTYGCQQNEADSERIAGMLKEMGYNITADESRADIIVINTCAVREHAELKALSITGQFKHLKSKKPGLLIGIGGCMVSQEHRKEDIKNKYPYVDFLFGTSMLYKLPEIIYKKIKTKKRQFHLDDSDGNIAEGLPVERFSDFKAWVSIMYGCNNFCTYCIVPYVRGRERSRKPDDILNEIRGLIKDGYREITLLGQNVNSYGKDLGMDIDFSDLLQMICDIEGDFTVRFMTSHPKDATFKLIDTIAANPKIAKQFHLPLQSGSDRILKLMNRHYTFESYKALADYMKKKIPEIAITTDIIVGFPGETEEDFACTLNALEQIEYDNIYSFIYSKRKGTPAAVMEDPTTQEEKAKRFQRLLDTQNTISNRKNQEYLGKIISVLVEGRSKTDDGKLTGRNEKNRLVHFSGDDCLIGKNVKVKIIKADTFSLMGEYIEK